jgi:hypothetical protein
MTAPPLVGAIARRPAARLRALPRPTTPPATTATRCGAANPGNPTGQRTGSTGPTSAPPATTSWPPTSSNTPTCSPTPATASKSPATAAPAEPAPSSPAWPSSPAIPPPTHSPGLDTTTDPEQSRLQANDAGSAGSPPTPTPAEQPTGLKVESTSPIRGGANYLRHGGATEG